MKKYKAILYDIDGTILNTLDMNMIPLLQIIKEETGEEWSFFEVLKYASLPGMKVMEELQIMNKEKTYDRWVQYVNEYEKGATLYEGFEVIFPTFQKHFLQAVVSAKTRAQYQIDFISKGYDQYMQCAILADDTQRHKPDPQPLLECIKRLGIKPHEALYVGDAYTDYIAAKRAHIDFALATWSNIVDVDIDDAAFIFSTPLDLLCLIDET